MSDRTILTCELAEESRDWCPDPFPGSEEARFMGCVCPHDQPWPGHLAFASDCPVHVLDRAVRH